ncbi:hypothetical protein SAMN02745824_3044 [Parasphingorhabdus marina DSM 22363]|uniref:DUF2332 domain-containing protein n=1 Tax=Parasphingorhabdus marina DSM 22363 TaxID=1123272 RepID=A0A1N6GXZ9_9SPHN|nr:DUF2332 domain-containing protein [Parasphingorhabdus marina]SIO12461.1 hypothetical protein SAMN02745824_3044 [Parasphingorhabdus marina DSM 22363]
MSNQDQVRAAFANQIEYCRSNGAPITGRMVEAIIGAIDMTTELGQRVLEWEGNPLADALPLRVAGGFHALHLAGEHAELSAIYEGDSAAIDRAEAIVSATIASDEGQLLPWLNSPPQTNEAGRSSSYIAGLLALTAAGLPPRFELLEIGSSAGLNLMIDRYRYDLSGVSVGSADADMSFQPEWEGPPPPDVPFSFDSIRGCDIAPVDLADPAQARRLKAYIWPEHTQRFERMETGIAMIRERAPLLDSGSADDWAEAQLTLPQEAGVTRVLVHSIVWQYIPRAGRQRVRAAMEAAGQKATAERPLAWLALEANRETYRHELIVRHWPGNDEPVKLGEAHAHGAWVKWLG